MLHLIGLQIWLAKRSLAARKHTKNLLNTMSKVVTMVIYFEQVQQSQGLLYKNYCDSLSHKLHNVFFALKS